MLTTLPRIKTFEKQKKIFIMKLLSISKTHKNLKDHWTLRRLFERIFFFYFRPIRWDDLVTQGLWNKCHVFLINYSWTVPRITTSFKTSRQRMSKRFLEMCKNVIVCSEICSSPKVNLEFKKFFSYHGGSMLKSYTVCTA